MRRARNESIDTNELFLQSIEKSNSPDPEPETLNLDDKLKKSNQLFRRLKKLYTFEKEVIYYTISTIKLNIIFPFL